MSNRILNTPTDPHLDAKLRKSMTFKDIFLEALYAFAANAKEYKHIREYFNEGTVGPTFEDIIKAVQDNSDKGKMYLEQFRQLTEMELTARGVYSDQAEKKVLWGQDVTNN